MANIPPFHEANLELLRELHEKYEGVLSAINAENEGLAKQFRTGAYDIGKWISSSLDQKASAKMKKAWYEMAASNLRTGIKALLAKLPAKPEQEISGWDLTGNDIQKIALLPNFYIRKQGGIIYTFQRCFNSSLLFVR